jgi:hypothetical protein
MRPKITTTTNICINILLFLIKKKLMNKDEQDTLKGRSILLNYNKYIMKQ